MMACPTTPTMTYPSSLPTEAPPSATPDVALLHREGGASVSPLSRPARVVSMFAGCGGFDIGLHGGFDFLGRHYRSLPFTTVWANEIDPRPAEAFARHMPDVPLTVASIEDVIDQVPGHDVLVGGFPCQDVSVNGARSASKGKRTVLYRYMAEAAAVWRPPVVLLENVRGLLSSDLWPEVPNAFKALGYTVEHRLLDASHYGVPQSRKRVFIACTRGGAFPWPRPNDGEPPTVRDAIRDLEPVMRCPGIGHVWSNKRPGRPGGQGARYLKAQCPAHTVRAESRGSTPFHYCLPRRVSSRELARMQSFPDDFWIPEAMHVAERMLGNAVPPVMAWRLASGILEFLA